jgi:hypothetical protein
MLSIGLLFRTTTLLAVPAILLLYDNKKERFKALICLFPGVIFVLLYNYFRFGNPLESGYSLAWSLAHSDKFDFWSLSSIPKAIFGFLFSPGKGLIFFSTTIILAILGLKSFWKKNRKMLYFISLISGTYIIIFSLNFAWHGSIWSYGPRYILPIVPFLYLPMMHIEPKKWVYAILFVFFVLQIELISVNYKRDVLSDYVSYNGVSDLDYLSSISKEPHLIQAKQLAIIFPKNFEKLNNYLPYSPWKKEIRTASSEDVIQSSIEKNSINFWWVRVFHWEISLVSRILSIIVLLSGFICSYILIKHVKRKVL